LLLFLLALAQTPDLKLAADVDSFAKNLVAVSGVPGMMIAVVRGDAPVLVKGYGFADIERRIPVTDQTAFYIASMTKAFTALTVALLADRGTVDLDAPLTRYLRGVQWAPDVHPDSLTLRRLLSHTHGLNGSGAVVWRTAYTGEHTNAQLKQLLRYHGLSGTGTAYRYTNLGYNIAGLAIDDLTSGHWQDAIATHVLRPLGMSHTTAYISRVDSAQRAMPYVVEPPAGLRRAPYTKIDANMQAAGGLVSTAADLAVWLEMQMNGGRVDGRQVFPARVIAETQRQQVAMTGRQGELPLVGYALGWQLAVQGSDTVYIHGGGFSTFRSLIAFDRTHRVGVAVATTEAKIGGGALELLVQYVLDRARNPDSAQVKYAARVPELPNIVARIRTRIADDRARRATRPQTLSKPLETYAGTYENPEGGTMVWTVREGRLWMTMGALRSVAEVFDNTKDQLRVELQETGVGEIVEFFFTGERATSVKYSGWEFIKR
jgi:CubicO group peptidase (beta-lactamase class C family)